MQRFADIKVWQEAHALVLDVYRATKNFPSEERYGLTSQLRRAVVSIAANIVEGSRRESRTEYARFLNISQGSLAETEYLMMVSRDLGYFEPPVAEALLEKLTVVGRMLNKLRDKVIERSDS